MHVSSGETSSVDGHSCLSIPFSVSVSLVSFFFAVVVLMVVGMRSSGKTWCGFCWVRVECDRSLPATAVFALFHSLTHVDSMVIHPEIYRKVRFFF